MEIAEMRTRTLWLLMMIGGSTLAGEVSTELRQKRQSSQYIDDRKVVCYYANWAVYRQGDAKFTPQNINPYLCTHLIYAFGGLGKDDTLVPFDEYQDIEKGGFGQFAALKTYNKDLKTMLAIGGWNEGSRRFSPLVEDRDRRQVFIKSAIRFLRQYNFDGIDLDWEYPTQRAGGRPQDRDNYATFIEEMREAFRTEADKTKKDRLLISMAVPASLEYAGKGYAIERLNKALDFFNLLTYDYHAAQEPAVNHHSPLFRPDDWSEYDFRTDLNIDSTVRFYLDNGATRDKLVLGIPTYGRSFTLANPDVHEIGSPATGPGEQGSGTKEDGYLAYYEICNQILQDGWDLVTQYPGFMGPYAHSGNQWVGFDDVDAVVEKAFYVAEEELGGIMFWTIDNDDFRGTCGKTPYPLIESAKEAMFSIKTSIKTETSVSVSTSEQTSVKRLKLTPEELANLATSSTSAPKPKRPSLPRRLESNRSISNSKGTSSSVTTPAPPTTPRSGPAFVCRADGFFPHPTSCKKYYWCLDTPNQGMVAHTFSCPQGLFFNQITDGCDFLRNVNCGDKDTEETEAKKESSEEEETEEVNSEADNEEEDVEDPKSLKDILQIVKDAGGIEGLEKQIKEEEEAKKEEEDRRVRISSKTRSRLSQLLNKGQRPKTETSPRVTTSVPLVSRGSSTRSEASLNSLFSRLANKRRLQPTPDPDQFVHEAQESQQRITIVGAHLAPEEPEKDPLVLGVFKPKDGVREKLRETLHNVLEVEMAERAKEIKLEEEGVTDAPNTVTISKNTRVEENRQRESSRNFASRARKLPISSEVSQDSNRYVTLQRGNAVTEPTFAEDDSINQSSEEEEDVSIEDNSSSIFRPTISDNLVSKEESSLTTTPTPFFPTFAPSTSPLPVILLTEQPRQRQQNPRKLEIISLDTVNELKDEVIKLGGDSDAIEELSLIATERPTPSPVRSRLPSRSSGRSSRPVPSRQQNESPRLRSKTNNVQLGRSRTPPTRRLPPPTSPRTTPTSLFQTSFEGFEPDQPALVARVVPTQATRQRVLSPQDLAEALISSPQTSRQRPVPSTPTSSSSSKQPEYEYEYYYDYLDDEEDNGHVADYDLVPLANKVRIGQDGLPQCYDVGVFPHPFSCKKFVNCYRNPGTGITGSIYQCPSYLAFDPVGGRCNWVNEIVCTSGQSSSSPARQR